MIYAIGQSQENNFMKEEQQVQRIKKQILELGAMLPGSLSEQWNVCGTLRIVEISAFWIGAWLG